MAESTSIAISPGNQEARLSPRETYEGSFSVINPFPNAEPISFRVKVAPFTVEDENFTLDFEDKTDYSQIVDWITLETTTGELASHDSQVEVKYKITVPADAPAGGQYAAFLVRALPPEDTTEYDSSAAIKSTSQVAMLLYATVAGETRVEGKVLENNISPVYLDTPLKTSVFLGNTGNVHSRATITLRVYPLFSDEEIYTTEETPETLLVLPGAHTFSERTWQETPRLGLYRVEQEVDFAGLYTIDSQTVLVAPTWLILLVFLFIVGLFYWLIDHLRFYRRSSRKSTKKVAERS